MTQKQKARGTPYTDDENRALMDAWQRTGSVVLISMILGRSESSIQTQASRLGLPPRYVKKDNPDRTWTDDEVESLDDVVAELSDDDGSIPIVEVASQLDRSVDAVLKRLIYEYGDQDELKQRVILPPGEEGEEPGGVDTLGQKSTMPEPKAKHRAKGKAGWQTCLSCRGQFYSEDRVKNRICQGCKRFNEGELDATPYQVGT